ncbi:hypothetical protein GVAV_000148 [Gurleya vavrai]
MNTNKSVTKDYYSLFFESEPFELVNVKKKFSFPLNLKDKMSFRPRYYKNESKDNIYLRKPDFYDFNQKHNNFNFKDNILQSNIKNQYKKPEINIFNQIVNDFYGLENFNDFNEDFQHVSEKVKLFENFNESKIVKNKKEFNDFENNSKNENNDLEFNKINNDESIKNGLIVKHLNNKNKEENFSLDYFKNQNTNYEKNLVKKNEQILDSELFFDMDTLIKENCQNDLLPGRNVCFGKSYSKIDIFKEKNDNLCLKIRNPQRYIDDEFMVLTSEHLYDANLNCEIQNLGFIFDNIPPENNIFETSLCHPQRKDFKSYDFAIDLNAIKEKRDKRTTCMIKNIPNKYSQKMLLDLIDEHHEGTFDFLYLRMDFKNKCNVGYAFINFSDPCVIPSFYRKIDGKGWKKYRSSKIAKLTYASIQGFASLVRKFKKSNVMCEQEEFRPKIFLGGYNYEEAENE